MVHGMALKILFPEQVKNKDKNSKMSSNRCALAIMWLNMQLGNDPQNSLEWIHTKYGPRPHIEPTLQIFWKFTLYGLVGGHPLETQCTPLEKHIVNCTEISMPTTPFHREFGRIKLRN